MVIDRLRLLRDNGVISADVARTTGRVRTWLRSEVGDAWDGEQCDMLVVHLAMALQRAVDGEPWSGDASGLADELAEHPRARTLAEATLQRVRNEHDVDFADGEVLLVAAYLATLLQEHP